MPPLAVNVAEPPTHIVLSFTVVPDASVSFIIIVGNGLTVIIVGIDVSEHPFELTAVTV